MWRAFFLAIGITLCIVGGECLGLERVVLKIHQSPSASEPDPFAFQPTIAPGPRKVITIKEYTPFSLMAMGAVVILYAYDLPRRMNS